MAPVTSEADGGAVEARSLPGECPFDPYDERVIDNPYPYYAWLRAESPCHLIEHLNVWVVSRHADIVRVCLDVPTFSSAGGQGIEWVRRPMMPMSDPPIHTRLRRIAQPLFTESAIAKLRPAIEARAKRVLRECLDRREFDFAKDFAMPLALGNIAALMGVDESMLPALHRWGLHIIEDFEGRVPPERAAPIEVQRREFISFLKAHLDSLDSGAMDASSMVGRLLKEKSDDRLTVPEVLAFCVLLLVAGYETTSHSLSNGMSAFLDHPDQLELLRDEPNSRVRTAVEEIFRYDTAAQALFRNTLQAGEVAGVTIPEGVKVMLLFASANRDEAKYERPDAFDITRKPEHLAFGHGIHYCLGAPLARLTLRIAWEQMLAAVKQVERTGQETREGKVLFRGLGSLPVRFSPA